ncbi:MAG: endonuclease/exonuclease/phosphatase family protein [candidate division WOR-3 bacterium]|jgi:endonuclease/exonuclease/phosphatase family metal-dependent hydrolase
MLCTSLRNALLATVFIAQLGSSSTARIATYNILNFPESIGAQRLDDFRTVLSYIDPDILVVQEMQSQYGVDLFLDSVMLPLRNTFASAPFHDGPGTDNALFYRQDKVSFLSADYIATTNRDIAEYRLFLEDGGYELHLLSVHMKASGGAVNEAIRLQEATTLRNYLGALVPGTDFVVAGDFNIYYSDEPAFQMMTDSLENNQGRLFDPLNMSGNWHENSSYASVHSQSTRVEQLPDGGAGGGLDDRFDMILCSQSLLDSVGLLLNGNSYTVCGNDGAHFNLSINYGSNGSVPAYIADALYWASDHLPVFVELSIDTTPSMQQPVVRVWPNPMQDWAQVTFPQHDAFVEARIILTNILGQRVYDEQTSDANGHRIECPNLPIGVYFLTLLIHTQYTDFRYETRVAVVK